MRQLHRVIYCALILLLTVPSLSARGSASETGVPEAGSPASSTQEQWADNDYIPFENPAEASSSNLEHMPDWMPGYLFRQLQLPVYPLPHAAVQQEFSIAGRVLSAIVLVRVLERLSQTGWLPVPAGIFNLPVFSNYLLIHALSSLNSTDALLKSLALITLGKPLRTLLNPWLVDTVIYSLVAGFRHMTGSAEVSPEEGWQPVHTDDPILAKLLPARVYTQPDAARGVTVQITPNLEMRAPKADGTADLPWQGLHRASVAHGVRLITLRARRTEQTLEIRADWETHTDTTTQQLLAFRHRNGNDHWWTPVSGYPAELQDILDSRVIAQLSEQLARSSAEPVQLHWKTTAVSHDRFTVLTDSRNALLLLDSAMADDNTRRPRITLIAPVSTPVSENHLHQISHLLSSPNDGLEQRNLLFIAHTLYWFLLAQLL